MAKQVQMSDETHKKLEEVVISRKKRTAHPASVTLTGVVADLISKANKRECKA
jgi:hypothetical protein